MSCVQKLRVSDRLLSLKAIVQFLDQSKQFVNIRNQCDGNTDLESFVYIFTINVNLHELFDKSVLLGEQVLTMPVDSSHLFHEVIYEYIKCQNLLPASVSSSQVLAKLCITDFPCKSFQICSLSDLTRYSKYKGLVKLTGIISGFSALTKYTQSTRYVCSDSNCNGHYGNHFIRIHIPGALETHTVRSDFMCTFCGGVLEEMISSRMISDKMVVEVLPTKFEGDHKTELLRNQFTQAVAVIIRDELVNLIEIGKSYAIIGICRSDYVEEQITITLEANSVTEALKDKSRRFFMINAWTCTSISVVEDLPPRISCIFHDCNDSGWRFLSLMAFHFASDILPVGKMIKLRLLLLISLVLYPQENKLHILAIGGDTDLALAVMTYASQFSCRSSPSSSASSLNGKVVNNRYQWAHYFVEGGCQLLSRGGVCFFGEIGLWKKARMEQLKNVLVSNKVMIELAPKFTESLPQTMTFSLSCHNWAIHDTSGVKSRPGRHGSGVFIGNSTGDLSKGFIDAFSIVAFLDGNVYGYDEESDLDYLDFKWRQSLSGIEDEGLPLKVGTDDFQKYLSLSRDQKIEMTVEAEVLLHSYFSASRLARTSSCGGSDVPSTAMSTLISLSLGISKLQLHNLVTESDAIMAIYLYEEYLTSRWGLSVLNVQAQSDVPSYEMENFFGPENDIVMQQFSMQLQQFCARVKDTVSFNRRSTSGIRFPFKEE